MPAVPADRIVGCASGGGIAGGRHRNYFDGPVMLSEDSTVQYTHIQNQILYISLHGSGGADLTHGRQYSAKCHGRLAFGSEDTFRFAVARGHGSGFAENVTLLKPVDRYGTSESAWLGFVVAPGATRNKCTVHRLDALVRWAEQGIPNLNFDTVYLGGGSMGGWGTLRYGIRHPEIFSAIYPDRPQWRGASTVNNIQVSNYPGGWVNVDRSAAPDFDAEDGGGNTADFMDNIAYASNTSNKLPWIGWCLGRLDGFANFADHVTAVAALRAAKRGFAFAWNNGNHGGGSIMSEIFQSYPPGTFRRGRGYPLFTDHSGDQDPEVDLIGGVNIGLSFRNVVESAGSWSCEVTSVLGARTVTVEPISDVFTAAVTPQIVSIPGANSWVPVSFSG